MSPTLKTTLFVSIALASFAGAAQAGSYKRLSLDSPLLGSSYDDPSIADLASDSDTVVISTAAKAAVEMLDDADVVETLLGDDLE
jgi:hypothetical protein